MLIPVGIVNATITGTPTLGATNHDATHAPPPSAFHAVTSSIDVIAGTDTVAPTATGCDLGSCGAGNTYFAINFNGVSFSGAQFYLYMSENGFANVNTSAGDIKYAGPFSASALSGTGTTYTCGSGGFTCGGGIPTGTEYWVGFQSATNELIVGAIPVQISTAYQYIKVYDGSCGASPAFCGGTGVAGAKQLVDVQPGIVIDVPSGPAWTPVHVSGGGFPASATVNINYTFTFMSWATGAASIKIGAVKTGISTGPGFFGPILMSMVDTMQGANAHLGPYPTTAITLTAVNATHVATVFNSAQNTASPVIFTEDARVFNQVISYFSGTTVSSTGYGLWDNDTAAPGVAPFLPGQPIDVYITGTLGIVGSNFTVSGSVSLWINGVQLTGSPVAVDAAGHWVANVTIPDLASGTYVVTALNNGVKYTFEIKVLPTLILTPSSGPVGQLITATAYGFIGNTWTSLWWHELSLGDGFDYLMANSTIDAAGSYNHTVTFDAPLAYGGSHPVYAVYTDTFPSPVLNTTLGASSHIEAKGFFTITPTLVVSPATVSSNSETLMSAYGTGFDPTLTDGYAVNIDNALFAEIKPALNGVLEVNFTAAGFRPGIHQIELSSIGASATGVYYPAAYAFWNVTVTGDYEVNAIASLQSSLTGIQTSLSAVQTSLTSVQSSITSITSSLTSVQSSLTSITSSLTGITSSLTSITSSLSGITSTLSSIQGSLTTITGDVSGLGTTLSSLQTSASQLQSSVSSLSGSVSGLGTQLSGITSTLTSMQGTLTSIASSASTAATQATNGAASAANAVTDSSTAETYVLVVAVLAAITLVLELAILVRKLS